jgi:hypothetical protein
MDVTYEAGTLRANADDRTVTGLLVPYGEVARSNLGRFSVDRGVFTLPEDVTVMNANRGHDAEDPVARFVDTTDTDAGLVAKFRIADGEDGDTLLAEIADGTRRALSAEVKNVVIKAGRAIRGRVFGAAFVDEGAFPSATLYAADAGDIDEDDVITVNGVQYARITQTPEGDPPTDDAAAAAESEAPVAETETAPEAETEDEKTLKAALPGSVRPTNRKAKSEGQTLFAALAKTAPAARGTLLAALDQAIAADLLPVQQQQWLGEVYASRTYQRRFANLVQHADLSGLKAIGWRFVDGKTPTVGDYAGYPAQPTSTEVKTEAVTLDALRLAGAGAVDRAFTDFPTPEFWAAYFREFTNDYERKLDAKARDAYVAGATAVTAGAVPAGVSEAAAKIVDGALAILDAERDLPSWAIVGSNLYRGLLLTRADDVVAFLSAALGLEEGQLAGFKIVPSSAANLASKVLVGTKTSATVFELPGSPVRVDTVNIANGGLERGVFGYHAELINDAKGLALVSTGS